MPKPIPAKLSRRQVLRQEAVFAKLVSLSGQVKAAARQRQGKNVPDDLRRAAEAVLFEVEFFRPQKRKPFPRAAADRSGLAAQLAEALAALIAFEARHTGWDARFDEPVWLVEGAAMRVRRLLPRPGSRAAAKAEARARAAKAERAARMAELRHKLVRRMEQFKDRAGAPDLSNLSPSPAERLE